MMSKRMDFYVPDAYADMVSEFMAAQDRKGLSLALLVSMAIRAYGMNDIVVPLAMGSGPVRQNVSSYGEDLTKRRRGRPKKSETNFIQERPASVEANTNQKKFDEPKVEPKAEGETKPKAAEPVKEQVNTSSYDPFAVDEYAKARENVPNISERENTETRSDFAPTSNKEGSKEHSGWSDDAFDGIDPDFNPDGGIDNVFELLQGN